MDLLEKCVFELGRLLVEKDDPEVVGLIAGPLPQDLIAKVEACLAALGAYCNARDALYAELNKEAYGGAWETTSPGTRVWRQDVPLTSIPPSRPVDKGIHSRRPLPLVPNRSMRDLEERLNKVPGMTALIDEARGEDE